TARLRDILGLKRTYRVVLVGAGRIGGALVQYPGFRQRGFHVAAIYDRDPRKVGSRWNGLVVRDVRHIASDLKKEPTDIAIVVTPGERCMRRHSALRAPHPALACWSNITSPFAVT